MPLRLTPPYALLVSQCTLCTLWRTCTQVCSSLFLSAGQCPAVFLPPIPHSPRLLGVDPPSCCTAACAAASADIHPPPCPCSLLCTSCAVQSLARARVLLDTGGLQLPGVAAASAGVPRRLPSFVPSNPLQVCRRPHAAVTACCTLARVCVVNAKLQLGQWAHSRGLYRRHKMAVIGWAAGKSAVDP